MKRLHRQYPGERATFAWVFSILLALVFSAVGRSELDTVPSPSGAIELGWGKTGYEIRIVGLSDSQRNALRARFDRSASRDNVDEWSQLFQVRVGTSTARQSDLPAMLGHYEITRDGVIFRPKFPLRPNLKYHVEFGFSSERDVLRNVISLPEADAKPTKVTQIYPTSDVLPENLLRFYVEFSAPMRQGDIYRYVGLFHHQGGAVDLPFLEIEQELWSRDGQRVMLLLDPGRVKRELKPRIESGPALLAGGQYELRVRAAWPDANGNPLQTEYRKQFRVVAADEECPTPQRWRVHPPAAGSQNALVIQFEESLDSAMLQRVLTVVDANDREISGTVATKRKESEWHFRPETEWSEGKYKIRVATILEDLAGNSIAKAFEVDLAAAPKRDVGRFVTLEFDVAPASD